LLKDDFHNKFILEEFTILLVQGSKFNVQRIQIISWISLFRVSNREPWTRN